MNLNELLTQPEIVWFLAGLLLLLVELAAPGLIIGFFGAGAWVTAIVCLLFPIPFTYQLLIFLVTSIASLLLLRRYLRDKFFNPPMNSVQETLDDEFKGRRAVVIKDITKNGQGKISFKGTDWTAVSDYDLKKGNFARIISKESIVIKVEPWESTTNKG